MTTDLPRQSLGHESDVEQLVAEEDYAEDDAEDDAEDVYEGNSMTLKEILLQADATQYDLLRQDQLVDDSFEW